MNEKLLCSLVPMAWALMSGLHTEGKNLPVDMWEAFWNESLSLLASVF